jgi:hypothetical protein
MTLFHQGLNPIIHKHLTLFRDCTLNELVSASIEQEDTCCAHMEEERKRGLCQGLLGALCPSTTWSTTLHHASHVVPLHINSGATIHLSRCHHAICSTRSRLLHLELYSLLGQAFRASTTGRMGTLLERAPSLDRDTLLGPHRLLAVIRRR